MRLVGRALEAGGSAGTGACRPRALAHRRRSRPARLTFRVGEDEVPTGLDLGVRLMHVGVADAAHDRTPAFED